MRAVMEKAQTLNQVWAPVTLNVYLYACAPMSMVPHVHMMTCSKLCFVDECNSLGKRSMLHKNERMHVHVVYSNSYNIT